MADETKRSSRSSSTGAARKRRTTSAAAASSGETAAETPATYSAVASAPGGSAPAASAPAAAAAAPAATRSAAYAPRPDPAPAVTSESSGGGGGVALAGLIAGVVGIVLALTYPQWTPIVYGSGGDKGLTADQVRAELSVEVEALKATLASMAAKQASLEQAVQTAKLPGILMVAEDLRSALGDSAPYAGVLNLFRSLTGDDPEAAPIIAAVESRAEIGIPGVGELQDAFDEVAHGILMAEQRPPASSDLASQVSETVASLAAATMRLRWRLDGAPTGDGVPAIVARAEQAVANGEFQAAVDTVGMLPEERRALAQEWTEMVAARMKADAAREDLDAYIIARAARVQ